MDNRIKSSQFGTILFITAVIVGYVIESGLLGLNVSQPNANGPFFGIGFWMATSGLAFLFSFGLHLLLRKKKADMEKTGDMSGDERMLEPFYGARLGERLGVVTSVALLGSLPVLSVFLVFSDLQPPWGKLFTAAAGIFALSIVSIYTTILFRKSREFYDRHELIIVPASMYIFLIMTFNYAMSLQSVPPPEGVSWGDLFIVIYSVIAIPLGIKLLLSANRTIFDTKARAEDELNFASEVQQQFLQDRSVKSKYAEGFGTSIAARQVGGDFLFLDTLEDKTVVAAVGDVSGHSFGAGLIMSMLVTITEDYIQFRKSPSGLMEALNRKLLNQPKRNIFATMGCIRLDGDRAIIWNAGHMPVLKYSALDGELTKIKPPGFALGMTKKAEYTNKELAVDVGDVLVLYSDGLVETRDKNREVRDADFFYSKAEWILKNGGSCQEIARSVLKSIQEEDYSDYPEDDLTIVVIRKNS